MTGNESLGWEQGRARDRASPQAGDPAHGGGWLMDLQEESEGVYVPYGLSADRGEVIS